MEASLLFWYLKKHGRRDPATGSIVLASTGSTYNRGDFTDTNAFLWSSLDLSAYHGTDLGSTPYYIDVIDAASKHAKGYIGAVGAGETLGGELITNGGMEDGSPPTDWLPTGSPSTFEQSGFKKHSGSFSLHIIDSVPNGRGTLRSGRLAILGATYKLGFWYELEYGGLYSKWYTGNNLAHVFTGFYYNTGTWSNIEAYFTEPIGGDNASLAFINEGAINPIEFYVDDVSTKRVTDPPSTAVHIVSSLNGTIRNWASMDSGFDPNNIASWNIYG